MKWFHNFNIATKLVIGFSVVILLSVALSIFSISQLDRVNGFTTDLGHRYLPNVRAASELKSTVLRIYTAQQEYANPQPSTDTDKLVSLLEDQIAVAKYHLTNLTALAVSPQEKDILGTLTGVFDKFLDAHNRAFAAFNDFKMLEGRDILTAESSPLYTELFSLAEQLASISNTNSEDAANTAQETYDASRNLIIIMALASALIASLFAISIARNISGSLRKAVDVAQRVASGDLTSEIEVTSKDETGQLMLALQSMNESLQKVVHQIRQGAETIQTASSEITSGNLDLSSRTEQQAGSLEETVSAMEELTSTVKQNADNSKQANQLAVSASEVATQGGNVVEQVVETMGSINDSSRKIVDIITVIDGIAFQTNILALNAAVEAARAGEQGRGFAVVASEVRSLAQRSANAAKEIKELINDSVDKVDTGSRLVGQAGTTMQEVVESIRRVSDIVAEITAASQEQSTGIQEVSRALSQMDEVTQQNAALVEQATAATQSMQQQATELTRIVSTFTLSQMYQALDIPATQKAAPAKRPVVDITPKNDLPTPATKAKTIAAAPVKPATKPASKTPPALAGNNNDDWEEF
jgi:methyl-accepting chemotaxis protein